jgi:ABC-type nickel/cobalt efflux system permease component RcnA
VLCCQVGSSFLFHNHRTTRESSPQDSQKRAAHALQTRHGAPASVSPDGLDVLADGLDVLVWSFACAYVAQCVHAPIAIAHAHACFPCQLLRARSQTPKDRTYVCFWCTCAGYIYICVCVCVCCCCFPSTELSLRCAFVLPGGFGCFVVFSLLPCQHTHTHSQKQTHAHTHTHHIHFCFPFTSGRRRDVCR